MKSTEFSPPYHHDFKAWQRYLSYIPIYALALPLVKILEAFGQFPKANFGPKYGDFGDYQPTENDVIACCFPKSGTTWLLQIALQIAFRGKAEFDHIHHVIPWPDSIDGLSKHNIPLKDPSPQKLSPTNLRVIKTHFSLDAVPYSPQARYIAVVRDPKDVVVSNYHFVKSIFFGPLMPTVEHWVDLFLSPESVPAYWPEHVASYWNIREKSNVLFLTYEEMKDDLALAIHKIADFMNVKLTQEEHADVLYKSSFGFMKENKSMFDPAQMVPWADKATKLVRKGGSGASNELLSAELQKRIDDHCRAELKRLNCNFPYDDTFNT